MIRKMGDSSAAKPALPHAAETPGHQEPQRFADRLIRAAVTGRVGLLAVGHLVCFALVYWLAFNTRFDFQIPAASILTRFTQVVKRVFYWTYVANC